MTWDAPRWTSSVMMAWRPVMSVALMTLSASVRVYSQESQILISWRCNHKQSVSKDLETTATADCLRSYGGGHHDGPHDWHCNTTQACKRSETPLIVIERDGRVTIGTGALPHRVDA